LKESEHRQGRGSPSAREKKSYDRPPDPNSPFAKLLVLKASMEEKNKQDS
jgi:ATP-dependent RNA helicase SUPV3L1/SUV3